MTSCYPITSVRCTETLYRSLDSILCRIVSQSPSVRERAYRWCVCVCCVTLAENENAISALYSVLYGFFRHHSRQHHRHTDALCALCMRSGLVILYTIIFPLFGRKSELFGCRKSCGANRANVFDWDEERANRINVHVIKRSTVCFSPLMATSDRETNCLKLGQC